MSRFLPFLPRAVWLLTACLLQGCTAHTAEDRPPAQPKGPVPPSARDPDALPEGALARLGTSRFRSPDRVCSVTFFPDGKRLVSGGWDSRVGVWDVTTGLLVRTLEVPGGAVGQVAVSPDGKRIAAGGADETLRVLNADTGKAMLTLSADVSDGPLAFSPAGDCLYASAVEHNPKGRAYVRPHLWAVPSGKELPAPDRVEQVYSAALSPEGKYLILQTGEGAPLLWDVRAGKGHRLDGCYLDGSSLIAVMPSGKELVALGTRWHEGPCRVSFWDLSSGKRVRQFPVNRGGMLELAVAPDGRLLATLGFSDRRTPRLEISLWDPATGKQVATLPGLGDAWSMAFSPDGRRLATGGTRAIRLWEVPAGKEIDPSPGHYGPVLALAFSSDGKSLASSDPIDPPLVWDVGRRKPRVSLPAGSEATGQAFALTPDGKHLAVARDDTCRLWDLPSGTAGKEFRGHWSAQSVAISGDGRFLAGGFVKRGGYAVTGELPRTLYLWDLRSGLSRSLETLPHPEDVHCVAFSADGKMLAAGGIYEGRWGVVRVLDTETGIRRFLASPTGIIVQALAFSPDGKILAGGGGEESAQPFDRERDGPEETFLALWDTATGKELRKLTGHRGAVHAVAFSPDGKLLASTGKDGAVCLWDVTAGQSVARLQGHRGAAYTLAFSPDGNILASGGSDTTILLWDMKRIPGRR
jgi:WD40 repeat protein